MSHASRERICFTLQVRRELLAEYRQHHAQVWPEMLDALRRHGWHNYSLFLRPDGLLVGYFETDDLQASLKGMDTEPVNERWQRQMVPFFENLDGRRPDEGFLRLDEIFHLA